MASFRLFSSFLFYTNQIQIDKSVDGVLGTQTRGGRMDGVDKSTELWCHPQKQKLHIISVGPKSFHLLLICTIIIKMV